MTATFPAARTFPGIAFKMPNGGMTDEQFYQFCQNMSALKEKMGEYIDNGCRLGWLIDPQQRETRVYHGDGDIHTVPFDELLNGGEVLPGFAIRMSDIWSDTGL